MGPALSCSKFGEGIDPTDAGPVEAGAVDSGPEAGPPSVYAAAVLASKPLVFWRFNEPEKTSASDLGSAKIAATTANVERLDQGSLVNESGDYAAQLVIGDTIVSTASTPDWFSANKPFAIELWLRLDNVPTSSEIIMHGTTTSGVGLVFESGGTLRVSRFENALGTKVGKSVLTIKTNHHVVATYNGTVLSLYIDGKIEDRQPAATMLTPSALPITVGTSTPAVGTSQLDATLDEIALYDRDLSLTEIEAHAKAGGITP